MVTAYVANRQYFRRAYRTGQHGWEAEEPSPQIVAYLRRLARTVGRGRLLDAGCGEGRHCLVAAALGFDVIGIDFEPLAVRRARRCARQRRARGVKFLRADVFRLPFPPGRFDVVVDCGCFHHQRKRDWPAYRRSLRRVLKEDGHFVLSVFSPRFRFFRAPRHWHLALGAYRRCFTRTDIAEAFGRDFQIIGLREDRRGGFWYALMKRRSAGQRPAAGGGNDRETMS